MIPKSRFSLLGFLFLVVGPFVLPQTGFAQEKSMTVSDLEEGSRFFGARRGALPSVKQSIAQGNTALMPAYEALLRAADEGLKAKPPTVTDKKRHPVTGNLNDYYTQAPYLWPDPSKSDGLPYLPKDGVINPESRNPDFADYSRGQEIGHLVETLALAYYLSGKETYAAHAARCLRVWFNDPATRMNPHLQYAQAVPGRNEGRYIGMIEAGGVVKAVDAAGLLDGSTHWNKDDRKALEVWITDFLDWFMNSEYGRKEVQMRQNHGTMFDLRVVRLALALGQHDLAREKLESVKKESEQSLERPNIIFILADDYSIMDTQAYATKVLDISMDSTFYETPNINRLMAEGVSFSQAYANQLCSPTRASIMTGKYASRLGFTTAMPPRETYYNQNMDIPYGYYAHDVLEHKDNIQIEQALINATSNSALPTRTSHDDGKDELSIAEALGDYHSAFIGKWHIGGFGAKGYQPADQGFEPLAWFDAGGSVYYDWKEEWNNKVKNRFPKMPQDSEMGDSGADTNEEYLTDDLTVQALNFIDKRFKLKDKPFFLYFSHFAVHSPYQGKESSLL